MAIDDLTKSILGDGDAEAAKILENAEKKRVHLQTEAEKARRVVRDDFEAETTKLLADSERRVVSSAAHEAKLALDKQKREALEKVFSDAYTKLIGLADAEYEALITTSLNNLPKEVTGTLYTATKRVALTEKALKQIGLTLSVEAKNDIDGGFIVVGDNFEYNATFKKAIADKKSELEITIASILFS